MRVQRGAYNTLDGDSNLSIDQCRRPAAYHADEGMLERQAAMKRDFQARGIWSERHEQIEAEILRGEVNPGACFHLCSKHAKVMRKGGYRVELLSGVGPGRQGFWGRLRGAP
jgi:hypothetical protein